MTVPTETRPLGIRPEVRLTEDQLRALRTIEEYDLTPVRNRLMTHGGMPPSWVDEAMLEFRRYMGLQIIAPGPRLMFSRHVDQVWHMCVLFTRIYADYCQQSLGHFLHHDPLTDPSSDPEPEFREFERLYQSVFGDLNRLWQIRR